MTRVILWFNEDGEMTLLSDPGVTVLWVDERVPHDRVFQMDATATEQQIANVLGDSKPGHSEDDRQARLKVQMHFMEKGLQDVGGQD